jgi:hypothetical protein
MPQMLQEREPHLSAIYIYSNNREFLKLLGTLKKRTGLTYRKLLRQMIEEVSASELLREKVQAHYDSFGATWKDEGAKKRKLVRISQDEKTIALASDLAFQLCNGSLSELVRLLIRFYAAEGVTVGEYISSTQDPKALADEPISPKNNVVSIRQHSSEGEDEPKEPKIPSSFTLDVETVALLGMLVQSMQMKSQELVSFLIEKYAANDDLLEELCQAPAWAAQIAAVNTVIKRFNFSETIESLLSDISYATIGASNKSAMIRALIRIEADLRGLSVFSSHRRHKKS